MIGSSRQVTVYAYGEPVDMRKSSNTLSALVVQGLKRDLLSGAAFLFVNKNRKRAKVLYFDGTGLCVLAKRMEKGRFAAVYERARGLSVTMTLSELSLFIEGSELVGKRTLSPSLMTVNDLMPRFPRKKERD